MKNFFLVFLLVFLVLSSACKKDSIKIEGVEQLEVPFCDAHPLSKYRVEDQSSFNILLEGFIDNNICELFTVPQLDFDEISVLGFETFTNTCDNDYSYSVDAKPEEFIYEFKVNVRISNECTEEERRMHWISLPKIPADYMVEFRQVNN